MTIPQKREIPNQEYATHSQLATWKWEKKHLLLAIGLGCLALWWFSSQIKELPWIQSLINWLPAIGGGAFAMEFITKLIN